MRPHHFTVGLLAPVLFACSDPSPVTTEVNKKGELVEAFAIELVGEDFYDLQWELDTPSGSLTELSSEDGIATSFLPDESGPYRLRLSGTDGHVVVREEVVYELTDDSLSVGLTAPAAVPLGTVARVVADVHDCKGGCLPPEWEVTFFPSNREVSVNNPEPHIMEFEANDVGRYLVIVRVRDQEGFRGSNTTWIAIGQAN